MKNPQRLSKVVAALVPCSRRDAEDYIAAGWVSVDGRRVEEPQFRVAGTQRIEVDPKANLQAVAPATLLLHKPAGLDADQAQAGPQPTSTAPGKAHCRPLTLKRASQKRG